MISDYKYVKYLLTYNSHTAQILLALFAPSRDLPNKDLKIIYLFLREVWFTVCGAEIVRACGNTQNSTEQTDCSSTPNPQTSSF